MKPLLSIACVLVSLSPLFAEDPAVIMRANFDEQALDGFQHDYAGALDLTDEDFSQGRFSLRDKCESGLNDLERYIKYRDKQTKLAFHYKSVGVKTIRVLARSVEDNENLYFNIKDVRQNSWNWAVVPISRLRNVVPSQGGPESPFGDRSGEGKTFKNIVFHFMDLDKVVEQPLVYIDNIILYSGKDVEAPTLVGELSLYEKEGKRLITWPDAKDNIGIAYYKIFRGTAADFDTSKSESSGASVIPEYDLNESNGAAAASGPRWYRIVAVDFDGNESKPGKAIEIPSSSLNREKK